MKNHQKGFIIPLLIAIVALLAIGRGVYVYETKKVETPTSTDIQEQSKVSTSDSKFISSAQPEINVLSPNGGENIKIGDKVGITWKNSSISTKKNVTIYLIQNLSGCFNLKLGQSCLAVVDPETIIASNIANTGFYSWTATNKGSHYLKICMGSEKTANSCDASDRLFSISDPVEMADKAPTISNVTGPTNLKVNENGTWTVFATDPEGKKISYSMSVTKTYPIQTNPSKIVGIKPAELYSPVINWKFDQVGTYLLEFTASDFYGKTATSNMTVTVQ